ncbi:tetratricopeptide repeat protein [Sedimentibacter sp. zth1]|uniref:tetratricopeptide repeat protein n=1 Tax=Sedimentibacter sp. zth1 TaxID=2816908 RepID=UPI001A92CC33|nr:tetratricopeptide repeat protein [Sedimentibacter sp. zth1]QSX07100.1 tetratricopeptide repeat protein [Sedimentibacter sp. zth1]
MKKSEKYFIDFFDRKKDDISFITLKKGAKITLGKNSYTTDKELPVPIRINSLIEDIQKQDEYDGVMLNNIVDGIIFLLGTNFEFEYKEVYLNILKTLNFEIEPYVIYCINQFDDKKVDDVVVYGKFLININENDKNCFVYASCLERKSVYLLNKELDGANYYMSESLKYFEKSLDYNNKFALSYYKLGFYYKTNQHYLKAKLYWEKQLEYDDDSNRIEEVREELENLEVYVQYETGYNYVLDGEPQRGLDILLPIVKVYNNWWNLLFFIGLAYRSLEEYEIAQRYFENVLQLNEGQIHALNELGLCRMCLEKYKGAEEAFTAALALEPKNGEFLCNRAAAYIYNGEKDKAKKDIEHALKINSKDEVALELKKMIQ